MSSHIETIQWLKQFSLDAYNWSDWVLALRDAIRLPVYDLTKILDAAAAWDIMYHARHWPRYRAAEIAPLRGIGAGLSHLLDCVELTELHQQMYAASALYSHCAKYTMHLKQLAHVPVDHMANIPVMPSALAQALVLACGDNASSSQIFRWLENVIVYNIYRPLSLKVKLRHSCGNSGGRRAMRRQSTAKTTSADIANKESSIIAALAQIRSYCPELLPRLTCSLHSAPPNLLVIVLSAAPPSPFCE